MWKAMADILHMDPANTDLEDPPSANTSKRLETSPIADSGR